METWDWQSIPLYRLPIGDKHSVVDIPPQGNRSLRVFRVWNNHVALVTDLVPNPMVHMIEPKWIYEGLIVVAAHDAAATQISFRLTCNAPESAPTLTLEEGGKGKPEAPL